jgi:hypothetical protein
VVASGQFHVRVGLRKNAVYEDGNEHWNDDLERALHDAALPSLAQGRRRCPLSDTYIRSCR